MENYVPYSQTEEITGIIPRGQPVANPKPDNVINEQAFYAATQFSENPVEDFHTAKQEMSAYGKSELVDNAQESWKQEQVVQDEQLLKDIIQDQEIPNDVKKHAVLQHVMGVNISQNLRDRYVRKLQTENEDVTQADIDHRDMWLDTLHGIRLDQDQAGIEVEKAKLDLARSLDYSALDMAGGIMADMVALRYGTGTAIAELATMHKDKSKVQRGWEFMKSVIFPGEANDKMNKWYNSLNDEDKLTFIKDLGDAFSHTPGFDYNKWNTFRDVLDSPEGVHAAFKHIENVAGILDFFAARGFLAAGFAGGFLRATKNVIRNWTTIDVPLKPRPMPTDRVDPHFKREPVEGDPNPRAGGQAEPPREPGTNVVESAVEGEFLGRYVAPKPKSLTDGTKDITPQQGMLPPGQRLLVDGSVPTPTVFRSNRTQSPLSEADITNLQRPRKSPNSPAGTIEQNNPKKAKEMFSAAMMDDDLAKAMGTDKGSIMADNLFPKLDKDVLDHPDISKEIQKMDAYFAGVYKDTEFDPFFVPVTKREQDKEKLFNTIKEVKSATYQQSNSVMRETIDSVEGVAVYGRNDAYGFSSADEAENAMQKMRESVPEADRAALYVDQKNGQWYVNRPYRLEYDPYEAYTFGKDAVSARFAGIDASTAAQSVLAKWIWHPTQRLPEWVAKGANRAHRVTGKVNADFMSEIQKHIKDAPQPRFLGDALRRVQEDQKWENFKDFSTRMYAAGHSTKDVEATWKGYQVYKRLTDYQYAFANRTQRRIMEVEDFKGIYDETGMHIGNGTTKVTKKPHTVYDLDAGTTLRVTDDLQGRTIVKLEEPISHQGELYQHVILGSKTKLGPLPENVIPKIEGYVPRQNIENFYVTKTPRKVKVDGELVTDIKSLKDSYTKTIAAGATKREAEEMMKRLAKEFPDHDIAIKQERADASDSILTDYKVFKEVLEHSKTRGERLPTPDGFARLEDPLEALWKTIQSTVRLDVWKDYDAVFRKNWLRAYGEFTKGEFPQLLTDIKAHANMTPEDLKQWKSAQRLFEQYTNQRYKVTWGDELWKDGFHLLADNIENVVPKYVSQALRDTAGKGNVLVRFPKTLASQLFLYLNPPRQWLVQTQQLLEWSALDKDYLKIAPTVIPAMQLALASKATAAAKHADTIYATAVKLSGMSKKEFDATFNALYKEGIPQGVDLNMMLHGTFNEAKQLLNPSAVDVALGGIKTAASYPGQIGKTIGYTPAELANTIGTWLFTRERWKKLNPGKNWNTPENIARISADAWEIGKAMSTRAGAMPYQDGALSLFFQFTAVQHKAFMEIFSSKTFTPAERAKLAAVRTLLWGSKGAVLGGLVSWLIGQHASVEDQAFYNELQGGLVDHLANKAIDNMLAKPGDKPSDLSISASMSPMPETLPYVDFIINATKLFDNDPSMPRYAFTGAAGSLWKAAQEIRNIYKVNEHGDLVSFQKSMLELAKVTSGYSNYMKMRMLQEMDDKIDRFGNHMGLTTTRAQAVAQMFGIITKEEEYLYKINETMRDRKDFIETRAQEIHTALNNFKNRWGTPEFKEWVRVQQTLNTFTPEELRQEVEARVDQLQLKEWGTRKDSAYYNIYEAVKQDNDKFVNKSLGYLKTTDPETYKRISEQLGLK